MMVHRSSVCGGKHFKAYNYHFSETRNIMRYVEVSCFAESYVDLLTYCVLLLSTSNIARLRINENALPWQHAVRDAIPH